MSRKTINLKNMFEAVKFGFSHATTSRSQKTIHCAGQVAWDKNYNIVGGDDLAAQCEQILKNLKDVLAAAGATPADVVRLGIYVVDYTPDKLDIIGAALTEFYGDSEPAANTLLGVAALAMPEFLIEIDLIAMVD